MMQGCSGVDEMLRQRRLAADGHGAVMMIDRDAVLITSPPGVSMSLKGSDERVSRRLIKIFDWLLVGFVGALLLAVIFLVVHRNAYLRSALDVAALVASVALAAALLATLRLPAQIRARIVLMISVSIATLYAMELFFFWEPLKVRGPNPRDGFDQRGNLEVVRDLRAGGTRAYPVLGEGTWLESPLSVMGMPVVPLSGVPHATIVLCNESGSYVTYESDRFGFNGPDEIWDLPVEIALVGDSFVEGWCVRREDSLAAVVRNAHPATLNVGYSRPWPACGARYDPRVRRPASPCTRVLDLL